MANPISEQTKTDSLKIAKSIQKPGQLKEQTKLISQGIEKGIAEYKKQQKAKSREADKSRKQAIKDKQKADAEMAKEIVGEVKSNGFSRYLPWVLLVLSWAGFVSYLKMFL
jgi:hypothetical protein